MHIYIYILAIPVAALSKAQACGSSPAETAASNPAEGMDVSLSLLLCAFLVVVSATGRLLV
jgi:hypothetical protein